MSGCLGLDMERLAWLLIMEFIYCLYVISNEENELTFKMIFGMCVCMCAHINELVK